MHHAPIQSTQDGVEVIFFFLVARLPHPALLDTPELAGGHLTIHQNLVVSCAMNGRDLDEVRERLNAAGIEDDDIFMGVYDGLGADQFLGPQNHLPPWLSFSVHAGRLYASARQL